VNERRRESLNCAKSTHEEAVLDVITLDNPNYDELEVGDFFVPQPPVLLLEAPIEHQFEPEPIVHLPMVYQVYSRRARILEHTNWYKLSSLVDTISAIRGENPNYVATRQQMLERLNNCRTEPPYAAAKRFIDGDYVCEGSGDWIHLFQQLRAALVFNEHDVGKKRQEGSMGDGQSQSKNDAIKSFWEVTSAMLNKCILLTDVFDRESFERNFDLVWQ